MILRDGRHGKFWGCSKYPECKGAHGAHPDGRPLGVPADKETKQARIKAHAAFDQMWKTREMSRTQAYQWLCEALGLAKDEAHIGKFTKEQCARLCAILAAKMIKGA
jgi:ssDNA-binding Zn-finger/Zn-ribbon topoisomerase 1